MVNFVDKQLCFCLRRMIAMISDQQLSQLCSEAVDEEDTQKLVLVLEKIRGALAEKRKHPTPRQPSEVSGT
jgi:hypothetical protein